MAYNKLVLSGGGVLGIAHVGALRLLNNEMNILPNIKSYVGSSTGSIMVSLLVAGYTPGELCNINMIMDYKKLKDSHTNKIKDMCIYKGDYLEDYVDDLLYQKTQMHGITFQQLYEMNQLDLTITGTCVNTVKLQLFNHHTFPEMKVSEAVRISSSIPIFYKAVKYNDKYYVDGGVVSSFPVEIINEGDIILGMKLKSHRDKNKSKLDQLKDIDLILNGFIDSIFSSVQFKEHPENLDVIYIDIHGISPIKFDLTEEDKFLLLCYGERATLDFIDRKNNGEDYKKNEKPFLRKLYDNAKNFFSKKEN